jgi:choline kinase
MKAVILAAGTSQRLRPLTDHTPKTLLAVAGVPILRRMMTSLIESGVSEFVIVTGYLEDKLKAAVREWFPAARCTFVTNPEYATKNNGSSLLVARAAVGAADFLLLDGDIIFDKAVVDRLLASGKADCLALRPSRELGVEEMKVKLGADGRVEAIAKTIEPTTAAGESIGIERFSAATATRLFAALEQRLVGQGLWNEYYESSFQQIVDEGVPLYTVDCGGLYCAEIDTPEDLAVVDAAVRARTAA